MNRSTAVLGVPPPPATRTLPPDSRVAVGVLRGTERPVAGTLKEPRKTCTVVWAVVESPALLVTVRV